MTCSACVLGYRPPHVLAHQRRRMIRARTQRRCNFRRRRGVTQPYGDVAQPALMPNAPNRAACEALVEGRLAPRKQLDECHGVETVADGKVAQLAQLGEAVPWAGELTIVAAIDAIADQRAQLFGNAALEFDSEIRDAAPRVELIRGDDGLGGADLETLLTSPSMLDLRRIDRQG